MHIDGHLEFTPEVAHFFTQIPYIFFNTVNLLIQPFDFDFNGGYISPNNLQFRNHQFLNNFFKIYRGHNNLLSHLKDTIRSFICQVRNRKTSNASLNGGNTLFYDRDGGRREYTSTPGVFWVFWGHITYLSKLSVVSPEFPGISKLSSLILRNLLFPASLVY